MSFARYVARRAVFAVLSVYLVVSIAFATINLTLWQKLRNRMAAIQYGGASEEEVEAARQRLKAAYNLDEPFLDRYLDWVVDVTTLQWGQSSSYRQPVIEVLDGRVPTTLEYLIPGVALALVLGVAFGVFTAFARDSAFDWSTRIVAYVLLGIPTFMVVLYYQLLSGATLLSLGGFDLAAPTLHPQVLAAIAVATALFAGQLRFARTATLEQSGQAFVKMLRAKGASRRRLARHVVRNAAVPILTLSLSETLAVLMLEIYVIETVLPIRGLGLATLVAARQSDVALVIWATLVVVVIGVVGNFLQDVFAGYLDPRARME